MRTPRGNPRRVGVKADQGSETNPPEGTTARWAGVKAPPQRPRSPVLREKAVSFGS
jgi:hypothetical protein